MAENPKLFMFHNYYVQKPMLIVSIGFSHFYNIKSLDTKSLLLEEKVSPQGDGWGVEWHLTTAYGGASPQGEAKADCHTPYGVRNDNDLNIKLMYVIANNGSYEAIRNPQKASLALKGGGKTARFWRRDCSNASGLTRYGFWLSMIFD